MDRRDSLSASHGALVGAPYRFDKDTELPLPLDGSAAEVRGAFTGTGGHSDNVGSSTTSTGSSASSTIGAPTTTIVTTPIATTTVALSPLTAGCFTIQVLGDCRVRVDATWVNMPVDR